MGLIKSPEAPASLSPFSMADIEKQAHAIILRAKNQAGRILVEAQRIGEELKIAAREAGHQEGFLAGSEKGASEGREEGQRVALEENRESLSQLAAALAAALTDLDASRRMLEAQATTDVLCLAIAIARRVTKRLGGIDPLVLNENVNEALKLTVRGSDVRVAIHPSQKQTLEELLPQLQLAWPKLEHAQVIEDESLTPGGCRIFTVGGSVDADLDGQIDRIAADLLPARDEATDARE